MSKIKYEYKNLKIILLVVGIILFSLNWIFPPYNGVILVTGDNLERFIGHYFYFQPPNSKIVGQKILNDSPENDYNPQFKAEINYSRLVLQMVVIFITLAFIYLIFVEYNRNRL